VYLGEKKLALERVGSRHSFLACVLGRTEKKATPPSRFFQKSSDLIQCNIISSFFLFQKLKVKQSHEREYFKEKLIVIKYESTLLMFTIKTDSKFTE
jgi:hypothetical protein